MMLYSSDTGVNHEKVETIKLEKDVIRLPPFHKIKRKFWGLGHMTIVRGEEAHKINKMLHVVGRLRLINTSA